MNEIEERIKSLPVCKCRACEHYIRVNFDGYRNVMNRQGFCLLGQLEGEYSLYLSTSKSGECMGYILSETNLAITEAEHQLDRDGDAYLESLGDKRTKNYKDAEPLMKEARTFLEKTEDNPKGLAWMHAEMRLRKFACEHFKQINMERFIEIYKMVSLRRADYNKFLARISIQIHDEFCKCQKIEFKEKETPEQPATTETNEQIT